jgi:hypothetical protein
MSRTTSASHLAPARKAAEIVTYDSHSPLDYAAKWDTPMGLGEMALHDTRQVDRDGTISLGAVPFQTGADAVFDHAKYFAVSHDMFAMPQDGSLRFSVDIAANTPGTKPGRVIRGHYTDTPDGGRPYAQSLMEAQQAALVLNMTNVETNQLFDWFVSGQQAFALIERLPSHMTNPTLSPGDPGYVGLDLAYTQIVKATAIAPGGGHNYAIRYTRDETQSFVEYLLDGDLFARVDHVGVPLDAQRAQYTGTYPSQAGARGEELRDRMDTFVIGHGLFNVLDPFPFQHPDAPAQAVSIPLTERLFGQGAEGTFRSFEITTVGD